MPVAEITWEDRIAEAMSLRSYQSDWDGMAAAAPNLDLIAGAFEHMRAMRGYRPPDSVGLCPNGSIVIFWQSPDQYLEAEISTLGRTEWMEMKPNAEARHWTELWQA